MRLVFVVPAFPTVSETFIVSKFVGLLQKGWDAHIVCTESKAAMWDHYPMLAAYRARVHVWPRLGAVPRWLPHFLRQHPRIWRAYVRKFGRNAIKRMILDAPIIALQPDILYFAFGSLAVGRTYLKQLLNCRLVVSFRGYDINYVGLDNPDHYQSVWEDADALHLLGQDLWQRAQRRGAPSTLPHVFVPPAIDTDFFQPPSHTEKSAETTPIRIVSVGRLAWKKGYEYALDAIRLLNQRGVEVEYRIIGDGNYLGCAAFARHQMGLKSVVTFAGAMPREAVREEMARADILLHAAVSEGFCNAVLEAQAMQLPVVCSDADGLAENVADGETGFVVARRNSAELAAKLHLLAQDPTLRQMMGMRGRQRVVQNFQLAQQVDAFDAFYRQLLT